MENEGRLQRYQILNSICKEYNTSDVLVAHHGDDQIETFLMRFSLSYFLSLIDYIVVVVMLD